jgi:hypothetical protein
MENNKSETLEALGIDPEDVIKWQIEEDEGEGDDARDDS